MNDDSDEVEEEYASSDLAKAVIDLYVLVFGDDNTRDKILARRHNLVLKEEDLVWKRTLEGLALELYAEANDIDSDWDAELIKAILDLHSLVFGNPKDLTRSVLEERTREVYEFFILGDEDLERQVWRLHHPDGKSSLRSNET